MSTPIQAAGWQWRDNGMSPVSRSILPQQIGQLRDVDRDPARYWRIETKVCPKIALFHRPDGSGWRTSPLSVEGFAVSTKEVTAVITALALAGCASKSSEIAPTEQLFP